MKIVFGIFELFCQSMAVASGLVTFVMVSVEEESFTSAAEIAVVGCVSAVLRCVFAFGFWLLRGSQQDGSKDGENARS
jgi:hypothetical protein